MDVLHSLLEKWVGSAPPPPAVLSHSRKVDSQESLDSQGLNTYAHRSIALRRKMESSHPPSISSAPLTKRQAGRFHLLLPSAMHLLTLVYISCEPGNEISSSVLCAVPHQDCAHAGTVIVLLLR